MQVVVVALGLACLVQAEDVAHTGRLPHTQVVQAVVVEDSGVHSPLQTVFLGKEIEVVMVVTRVATTLQGEAVVKQQSVQTVAVLKVVMAVLAHLGLMVLTTLVEAVAGQKVMQTELTMSEVLVAVVTVVKADIELHQQARLTQAVVEVVILLGVQVVQVLLLLDTDINRRLYGAFCKSKQQWYRRGSLSC